MARDGENRLNQLSIHTADAVLVDAALLRAGFGLAAMRPFTCVITPAVWVTEDAP